MGTRTMNAFEGWVDPEGGSWFRMTGKDYNGAIWRPVDLGMSEDGNISFSLETFEGEGTLRIEDSQWQNFGETCGKILKDVIAAEVAEMEQLKEEHEPKVESDTIIVPGDPRFDA